MSELKATGHGQYYILGVMVAATIAFHVLSSQQVNGVTIWDIMIPIGKGFPLAWSLYMSGSIITAISSFLIAKKYMGSQMFTKAYFCLGLGFCFWFFGDLLYAYDKYIEALPIYYQEQFGKIPFQLRSYDFVYLGVYPCTALHLYFNTNWFEKNKLKIIRKSTITKFCIYGVPSLGALVYFYAYGIVNTLQFPNSINPESIFGALNTVGASVTLGLVIWGARTFRASSLSPAWTLLLAGIFFSAVGDYFYYSFEQFNEVFSSLALSTPFYVLMYMIMNYALYKHAKTI